jgi:pyruvate dehydrogenase phosphatase
MTLVLSSLLLIILSDDLTVQVIFFGHGEKTGEVTVNLEATAGEGVKAKL